MGYDESNVYVHDNDMENVQRIPHADLALAWKDGYVGSSANTAYGIDMSAPSRDVPGIISLGLSATAKAF